MASWQENLAAQARAREERLLAQEPSWTVRAIDPPTIDMVWALRYTREMHEAHVGVAEDLSLMSSLYERHIIADFRNCEDGIHVLFEFLPPIEAMAVRPECMTGVVSALRRSGYHCRCYDGRGKHYEF